MNEKRKQPGIAFPSARNQEHLFIIRFNISESIAKNNYNETVRTGLKRLCELFEKIANDEKKINKLSDEGNIVPTSLSDFNFSATIGFGIGFFGKLNIDDRNIPKKLKSMPDHSQLADLVPYSLPQTDFIIQLGSKDDYVNRWVFQNHVGIRKNDEKIAAFNSKMGRYGSVSKDHNDPQDISDALNYWAMTIDLHAGFQRLDGKNLLGFNDGVSNPFRLSNKVIWTTSQVEGEKFRDGTYMVFQKIEHDLEIWRSMHEEKQEQWVGRSKGTGLLLGTLSSDEDRKLAIDISSDNAQVRNAAVKKWKRFYNQQKIPETKFYDPAQTQYRGIQLECPVWSHVRKANPRQADGAANILIFRRGYLFTEDRPNARSGSGLLFICFQNDIENGFEYIKKNFLNNKDFPVPKPRKHFNSSELENRREQGRFTTTELQLGGLHVPTKFRYYDETQNTGRDGLSGPSELGVYPQGQIAVTKTLGGGYYFIPPIPRKKISEISEQFFT
jgi:Dyp-type peroxidase family